MTNYKEIIRLHSLGLNKTHITESCGCARSTVITALHKAEENGLSWNHVSGQTWRGASSQSNGQHPWWFSSLPGPMLVVFLRGVYHKQQQNTTISLLTGQKYF